MFFLIRKGESLRHEQFIKEIVTSFISSNFVAHLAGRGLTMPASTVWLGAPPFGDKLNEY